MPVEAPRRRSRLAQVAAAIFVAIGVFYIVGQCGKPEPPGPATTASQAPAPGSSTGPLSHTPEGEFFGAAISYLMSANQLSLRVARTETGLNDGSTTLLNLRDSANVAADVERAAYTGDYHDRLGGHVPPAYRRDADEIDRIHGLLSSSLRQTASAAESGSADGAASATRTFSRAVHALRAEVASLDRKLAAYTAAHPGDTVAYR